MDEPCSVGKQTTVAVLLCTHNGERFLEEQLRSIAGQRGVAVRVHVSDDGSTDGTVNALEGLAADLPQLKLRLRQGPGRGHVANFLSQVCDPAIEADYFAYSDQDDVWEPDKLARALAALARLPDGVPALYCARTRLIDEDGRELGESPLFRRAPAFANALLQNIAGGNTMVMNRPARALLLEAGMLDVVTHDWWTYLLVSAAGGQVIYDPGPSVRYRQHGSNLVGSGAGWISRSHRFRQVLHGRSRSWNERNIRALQRVRHLVTPDNRRILDEFASARESGLPGRVLGTLRSGVYLQTFAGNIGLCAAVLLGKL